MDRLTFDEYGCLMALVASLRGEDYYTKCGSVGYNKDNEIVAASYNGFAKGQKLSKEFLEDKTKKNLTVRHAEGNLLARIKKGELYSLYTNISPCRECAKNIAIHEIKKVVFIDEYHREQDFKKIFDFYGIQWYKLNRESLERVKQTIQNNILDYLNTL